MTDSNLSLVLRGKGNLALEEIPVFEPGPGQVKVSMRRVGICGSDVHMWQSGRVGPIIVDERPLVLGHEGSAVVTELGEGVTSLKVGDRVVIEPATTCRLCSYCKGGRYNLCLEVKGLATPGVHGNISRTFVHDADFCHKIPDTVSFEEGAVVEPLSVSVHATTRAGIKMGQVVLVTGAGPIGILCMLVARARGIKSVCITDIDEKRLAFAKKLGADQVINVMGKSPDQVAKEAEQLLGTLTDVSIECSGSQAGIATAIKTTRAGGTVLAVGFSGANKDIDLSDAIMREVEIKTAFRYCNSFPSAIDLLANKQIDVNPLITHNFTLEESIKGFDIARDGKGIKVVIDCERRTQKA